MKIAASAGCLVWISRIICFSSVASLSAEQFGLFTYRVVGDSIEISDYPTDAVGEIEIPPTIEGRPVTTIGGWAFYQCISLTRITIPDSVTTIGGSSGNAFSGCSGLTSITIPSSVTSVGYRAFRDCSGLTSIIIPSSVTTLGAQAFQDCSALTSITIPSSVPTIGWRAFWECSALTSITIPSSVTTIGRQAFTGCSGLTSITIPSGVTSIGEEAFLGCSGLTSILVQMGNPQYVSVAGVLFDAAQAELIRYPEGRAGAYTIPSRVTIIGRFAFYQCSGLTSVTIPSSVTSIGRKAFHHCSGLTSILVQSGHPRYLSVEGVLFSVAQTKLIQYPGGRSGAYTIPSSATSIGYGSFSGCSALTSITIPSSVTEICDEAFADCTGLTSALFLGDAPELEDDEVFDGADPGFTVYYLRTSSGFSTPTWEGYPAIAIDEALYSATINQISSITFTPDGLRLELSPPVLLGPGDIPFGALGRSVGVEYSPDLSSGSWIELGNFFRVDGVWTFTDPDFVRLARPAGFYRAFLRPPPP